MEIHHFNHNLKLILFFNYGKFWIVIFILDIIRYLFWWDLFILFHNFIFIFNKCELTFDFIVQTTAAPFQMLTQHALKTKDNLTKLAVKIRQVFAVGIIIQSNANYQHSIILKRLQVHRLVKHVNFWTISMSNWYNHQKFG